MNNKPTYDELADRIELLDREHETLHNNIARLDRATEIAKLGIWEWCATSGVVYSNTNFLDMTGLTKKEMDNFSFDFWLNRLHPDDRKHTEERINALFKGETELIRNEFRILHPEKKWVWLYEIDRVVDRDVDGSPLCIISVHQDISDRRQIKEELNEVKATLENILNSVIPICVTNMQYEIILTNESYNSIFGKPTSGMRCFESRSGPSCHTKRCPIHQIHTEDDQFTCEITKQTSKDEPAMTFIVTAKPFYNDHKNVIGFVESFQDISKRKYLEIEKNQLIDKLQKALSEVKQLSGFLPICASCKKIRDDQGYWNQIESYIRDHSEAEFSHGLCPECAKKLYPTLILDKKPK